METMEHTKIRVPVETYIRR